MMCIVSKKSHVKFDSNRELQCLKLNQIEYGQANTFSKFVYKTTHIHVFVEEIILLLHSTKCLKVL